MARRSPLGCLCVSLVLALASVGCKGGKSQGGALDARCEALAKTCADTDKHVAKLVEGCTQAAAAQAEKGCTDKVTALYDCYEKELCGKADKVWALDDLRVLAERKGACASERKAVTDCTGK